MTKKPQFIGDWVGRRFWESRQFYSAYIALFISVTNWITIQYTLVLDKLPALATFFSNIWEFMIIGTVIFVVVCIFGGHYIHRKRQFRIEQAVAVEENPYLYKAVPGKEKDLMIPIVLLQLETLEELLHSSSTLTEQKKKQFQSYRRALIRLMEGESFLKT